MKKINLFHVQKVNAKANLWKKADFHEISVPITIITSQLKKNPAELVIPSHCFLMCNNLHPLGVDNYISCGTGLLPWEIKKKKNTLWLSLKCQANIKKNINGIKTLDCKALKIHILLPFAQNNFFHWSQHWHKYYNNYWNRWLTCCPCYIIN